MELLEVLDPEKTSTVFSNPHIEHLFSWFYYQTSGRLNVLIERSQLSSICHRTASSLTIAFLLLDRVRSHSIVRVHEGQEAVYCTEVPYPAIRAERSFRDTHSTDRVSPPPNGLALHSRGRSESTGGCNRHVQLVEWVGCRLHLDLPGWQHLERQMK